MSKIEIQLRKLLFFIIIFFLRELLLFHGGRQRRWRTSAAARGTLHIIPLSSSTSRSLIKGVLPEPCIPCEGGKRMRISHHGPSINWGRPGSPAWPRLSSLRPGIASKGARSWSEARRFVSVYKRSSGSRGSVEYPLFRVEIPLCLIGSSSSLNGEPPWNLRGRLIMWNRRALYA